METCFTKISTNLNRRRRFILTFVTFYKYKPALKMQKFLMLSAILMTIQVKIQHAKYLTTKQLAFFQQALIRYQTSLLIYSCIRGI